MNTLTQEQHDVVSKAWDNPHTHFAAPTLLAELLPEWEEEGKSFAALRQLVETRENRVVSDNEFITALADHLTNGGYDPCGPTLRLMLRSLDATDFPEHPVHVAVPQSTMSSRGVLVTVGYARWNNTLRESVYFTVEFTHHSVSATVQRGCDAGEDFTVDLADPHPVCPKGFEETVTDVQDVVSAIYTSDLWARVRALSARVRGIV